MNVTHSITQLVLKLYKLNFLYEIQVAFKVLNDMGCCFSARGRHAWGVEDAFAGGCSGGVHSSNGGGCPNMTCSGDCRIFQRYVMFSINIKIKKKNS